MVDNEPAVWRRMGRFNSAVWQEPNGLIHVGPCVDVLWPTVMKINRDLQPYWRNAGDEPRR